MILPQGLADQFFSAKKEACKASPRRLPRSLPRAMKAAIGRRTEGLMRPIGILFAAMALAASAATATAQPANLAAAVGAPSRTPDNVKLDEGRKPVEVLSFFGLR